MAVKWLREKSLFFCQIMDRSAAVACAEMSSHSRGPGSIRVGVSFTTGAVRSAILAAAGLLVKIDPKAPFKPMGAKNLQKLPSQWSTWTPSNTRIPRPTQLTTPNGIQIQSAVFPQFTHRTDRPTYRLTDGIGDRSVRIPVYDLLH